MAGGRQVIWLAFLSLDVDSRAMIGAWRRIARGGRAGAAMRVRLEATAWTHFRPATRAEGPHISSLPCSLLPPFHRASFPTLYPNPPSVPSAPLFGGSPIFSSLAMRCGGLRGLGSVFGKECCLPVLIFAILRSAKHQQERQRHV